MAIDPMTAMMMGGAGAQAGGSILGGFLGSSGGISTGDLILPSYDSSNDPGISAAQFDAMNLLGFGNINNVAGPLANLINRINATSTEEKTKRRALKSLGLYAQGQEETNPGRLDQVLSRIGISRAQLDDVLAQDKDFRAQQSAIYNQLGPMNRDAILGRAQAAAAAGRLLGGAGAFATGADPTDFQQSLLDRVDRNIADQREALMLQAQYGGFNPSAGLEGIQRMTADRELTALTQAVQAATALTQGLAQGNQLAQQAAGLNSGAALQGLGIAAQQSMAANQLAQQSSVNKWDSLANGLAGGLGALGQGLMGSAILGGMGSTRPAVPQSEVLGGPGSTFNQLSTQSANYGGWNPSVSFR